MTTDKGKIMGIQSILGVTVDGIWGPESQAALDELIYDSKNQFAVQHETFASSFADPADIKAYDQCIADGGSEDDCLAVGDNGIGCWGDSTKQGTGPSCALPPEYMEEKWGSVSAAKHKKVRVIREHSGESPMRQVVCVLKDRMPHVENLHNEAHIDLNPDACAALGWKPPIMEPVVWFWVADEHQKGKT
jgi:hypothetical protein